MTTTPDITRTRHWCVRQRLGPVSVQSWHHDEGEAVDAFEAACAESDGLVAAAVIEVDETDHITVRVLAAGFLLGLAGHVPQRADDCLTMARILVPRRLAEETGLTEALYGDPAPAKPREAAS